MKVLYLPIGSQPATERGFGSTGVNLRVFDFLADRDPNTTMINIAREFMPDLIHMQLQMTGAIKPQTLTSIKSFLPHVKISNWTGDIRASADRYFIDISQVVDVSLISSVGQLELYRNSGCKNPVYWQIGFDEKTFHPTGRKDFDFDVVFLANAYNIFPDSRLRYDIAIRLKNVFGHRCGIFGSGYPPGVATGSVEMKDSNNLYNNSVCALSVSNFNDVSHYFSDRFLICVGTGRPAISYRFPGIENYFIHNSEVLVANNIDEIIQLINKCKENPEWASAIGLAGHRRVSREHSYTSRALELFNILGLNI